MLLNRRGFATSVFCRQCGVDARVPELQPVADGAPRGAPRALPLLQLRHPRCRRPARTAAASTSSRSASAPSGSKRRSSRSFPAARVARVDRDTIRRRGAIAALLARFAARRDRRPGRHADDRQGARFPARDAGRRDLRRRRARAGGFPRRRADVPTADAGGRPRRTRRDPGRGDRPDAVSGALQHPPRLPPGLRGVLRGGDRVPPRRCAIRRRSRSSTPSCGRARSTRRCRTPASIVRALRSGGEPFRVLGPAPAPLSRLQGRAPRPVLPQGGEPRRRCAARCRRRSASRPRCGAGPPSTSTRCRCCEEGPLKDAGPDDSTQTVCDSVCLRSWAFDAPSRYRPHYQVEQFDRDGREAEYQHTSASDRDDLPAGAERLVLVEHARMARSEHERA